MAQYPTSKIAMYNGLQSFYSLDSSVIEGVLDLSLSDPTYLGFRVFFDLDAESGLFGSEVITYNDTSRYTYKATGEMVRVANKNCALSYLKRIGDESRYDALVTLIKLLKALQTKAFHCFSAIDGLQDLWNRNVNDLLIKDKKINLTLTESVDWRMTTIASLIQYICYDFERKVYVLPENLRMFNMVVYVTELRIFAESTDINGKLKTDNKSYFGISESSFGETKPEVYNDPEYLNYINELQKTQGYKTPFLQSLNDKLWGVKTTTTVDESIKYTTPDNVNIYCTQGAYVMFGLGDCEFETDTGSRFFETIDMSADPNMRSSNMSIKYGSLHTSYHLPITGEFEEQVVTQHSVYKRQEKTIKTPDNRENGLAPTETGRRTNIQVRLSMGDLVRKVVADMKTEALDYAKQFAQNTTLNLMTEAAMQASRNLVGKVVGNAFNFNAVDLATLTNPQNAFMKVKQAIKQATTDKPATIAADSNRKAMSESPVYKESGNKKQSLPVKNIYDNRNSL